MLPVLADTHSAAHVDTELLALLVKHIGREGLGIAYESATGPVYALVHLPRVYFYPSDALTVLDEEERLQFINRILVEVRRKSDTSDKLAAAALAITESGDVYTSVNTQQQHNFHKDCAEVNAINAITQQHGANERIRALYLMIGFGEPNANASPELLQQPLCPCGKCADALQSMWSADGQLTLFPPNDGQNTIPISTAPELRDVKPGHAWSAPASFLYVHQRIPLDEDAAHLGQAAYETLRQLPVNSNGRPHSPDGSGTCEVATLSNDADLTTINRHLTEHICRACAARPHDLRGYPEVSSVRAVLVRMEDDTFHTVVEVIGRHDNATPHAETVAVSITRTNHQRIEEAWIMTMTPDDIRGGWMHTSSNEGLERLYKRGSLDMPLHYIPFNDGSLSASMLESIVFNAPLGEIFPSGHKGTKRMVQEDEVLAGMQAQLLEPRAPLPAFIALLICALIAAAATPSFAKPCVPVAYQPAPDVAYQPGKDVHGWDIPPADLPSSPQDIPPVRLNLPLENYVGENVGNIPLDRVEIDVGTLTTDGETTNLNGRLLDMPADGGCE